MNTVTPKDGTRIAYDRYGSGPALILVGGALSQRRFKKFGQLASLSGRGMGAGHGAGPRSLRLEEPGEGAEGLRGDRRGPARR
jgi:hypothetical protein